MTIFFFIILFLCFPLESNNIITSHYYGQVYPFTSRIEFVDNNNLALFSTIDLQSNHTWYSSNEEDINTNIVIKRVVLDIKQKKRNALECISAINIYDNKNLTLSYHYYITLEKDYIERNKIGTGFGFAYRFHDESFSLIHQLYNNCKISKKAFAIGEYHQKEEYGLLYFGGLPEEEIRGKGFQGKCKVNKELVTWSCQLNRVDILGNSYSPNKEEMLFQTNYKFISVPKSFLMFLNFTVFQKSYGYCFYKEYDSLETFKCVNTYLPSLPNITFIFDDYAFIIPMFELFVHSNEISESAIVYDHLIINNNNTWVFGNYFLSKYVTLFDYDEPSITFYSNMYSIQKQTKKDNRKKIIRMILFILISILSFKSIYFIFLFKTVIF